MIALPPALVAALDAIHAAYARSERDEGNARSPQARALAAGRRMAYSHALSLLSRALSEAVRDEQRYRDRD